MSYLVQLAGWALLQAVWQTLTIGFLLVLMMRLMRRAPADVRYHCAVLHLAAAIGAIVLTLVASHVSVAAGVRLDSVNKVQASWLPRFSDQMGRLLPLLAWSWLGGIVITQTLLAVRVIRLRRLVRSAAPAAAETRAAVEEMSLSLGMSTPPKVCCADVQSPLVAGWRFSSILVPRTFLEMHPPVEARALLAHELAHVLRRDYSRNILQLLSASILWWHPGVWLIYSRIRHERECASDEHAVRITGSATGLASGLFRLAAASAPADAALVAADSGLLADRISRIAEPPVRQTGKFTPLLVVGVAAFMAVVVVASATATREAILTRAYAESALSPPTVFTIHAHDPAGTFLVQMVRGRVVGIVLGQEPVPSRRVTQRGNTVRVVGQAGQDLLRLEVDPRGGFRWTARRAF